MKNHFHHKSKVFFVKKVLQEVNRPLSFLVKSKNDEFFLLKN